MMMIMMRPRNGVIATVGYVDRGAAELVDLTYSRIQFGPQERSTCCAAVVYV